RESHRRCSWSYLGVRPYPLRVRQRFGMSAGLANHDEGTGIMEAYPPVRPTLDAIVGGQFGEQFEAVCFDVLAHVIGEL
ncbi:hypothetical protein, partial [Pseudomonas aeruginosa]|uniref:hypothetical protein n=1 Tax=Pseudomonas aeruginosa TaxID=287 RepID=UPI003D285FED